jgi:hypothetical protein
MASGVDGTGPRGGRPAFPFPYSEEVWTGIEYTSVALLAYQGLVNEALAVVKAVRGRYDGSRRNPFDEFECGHHYARAMASWAVLLVLTGFAADLPSRRMAFSPRLARGRAESSSPSSASRRGGGSTASGSPRAEPRGGFPAGASARAFVGGREAAVSLAATARGADVRLSTARELSPGRALIVEVGPGRKRPMAGGSTAAGSRAGRGSRTR